MLPIEFEWRTKPMGAFPKYPFGKAVVGEQFIVPVGCEYKRVRVAASAYGKRNGMKFITRKQPDGSVMVMRLV